MTEPPDPILAAGPDDAETRCPWCSAVLAVRDLARCPSCGAHLTRLGVLDDAGVFHVTPPPGAAIAPDEIDLLPVDAPLSPDELDLALAPPSPAVRHEMAEVAPRDDEPPAEPGSLTAPSDAPAPPSAASGA